MTEIPTFLVNGLKLIKSNSPEILSGLGITGVISTAYLTGKATFSAAEIIRLYDEEVHDLSEREKLKEKVQLVWKLYIPAGISGLTTVACVFGANKASGSRTAAAVTAYSVTEKAFAEYKEKVVEQIGKNKEQQIRDDLVQQTVIQTAPKKEIIVAGTGHILCCELYTQRYFRSDMEKLRRAQNDVNARIVNELYVTLNQLYDILGLDHTSGSANLGWTSDKLLEFEFSTVMSDNGEPCLAFDYNYVKPL